MWFSCSSGACSYFWSRTSGTEGQPHFSFKTFLPLFEHLPASLPLLTAHHHPPTIIKPQVLVQQFPSYDKQQQISCIFRPRRSGAHSALRKVTFRGVFCNAHFWAGKRNNIPRSWQRMEGSAIHVYQCSSSQVSNTKGECWKLGSKKTHWNTAP